MSRPIDHGDENQVDPIKKKKKLQHEEEQESLRRVLGTYDGRAVLWKLMADCNMFSPVPIGDNPLFLAGATERQNVGKRVLEDILTLDANSFNLMRDEATLRKERAK